MAGKDGNEGRIEPVFLVVGSDELKRTTVRKRLIERAGQRGDLDFNMDVFDGEHSSVDDIIVACQTVPFASDMRLVLVDRVEKLSSASQHALAAYCRDPSDSTVLCLVAEKLAKNTVLFKAVSSVSPKSVIDCSPKSKRELPALVAKMANTHRVSIDPRASSRLIELVGESTVHLDNELSKMATALGHEGVITLPLVESMVVRSVEVKPWALTDALSMRDTARVESVLSKIDLSSPLGLLSMCVNRIRDLMTAHSLLGRGKAREIPAVLGRPEWQVKNYAAWAERFTSAELVHALHGAAQAERDMKSGGDPQVTFEFWLLDVCTYRSA